jgi:hypothetical protein
LNPLFYIFIAAAIGFLCGRYQGLFFQNRSEARVSRALKKHFPSPDYHLLNHVTLQHNGSSTQLDHILISRFGIFVIETKDFKGWIFANASHPTWTQVLYRKKFKFQNPLRQNYGHVQALQDLLDFVPPSAIHSVVVFAGEAEFKTEVPMGVYSLRQLIEHLSCCKEEVLSMNRVQFCVGRIETSRLSISGQTDLEHVRALQRRHGERPS